MVAVSIAKPERDATVKQELDDAERYGRGLMPEDRIGRLSCNSDLTVRLHVAQLRRK